MQCPQCVGEARIVFPLQPGRILPLRQFRQTRQGAVNRLAHLIEAQPFSQRIDRFDQRQARQSRLVDDAVGMHHLQHAVVKAGRAGDVAKLADRQKLFQIVTTGVEEGQDQGAGLVAGIDLVGHARPVRRRWPMPVDGHRHGDHRAGNDVTQFRTGASIDDPAGQMKQEIDRPSLLLAADEAPVEALELRTDAGQRGESSKERIEPVRAHVTTPRDARPRCWSAARRCVVPCP